MTTLKFARHRARALELHTLFRKHVVERYCKGPDDEPVLVTKIRRGHRYLVTVRSAFARELLRAWRAVKTLANTSKAAKI